jgi:DNA-binding MarR family transcriptional regulator
MPSPRPVTPADLAEDLRGTFGRLKRRMREQANVGELTASQGAVLLRLEKDGPATTSGLARAEAMRPQSMAAVVAALDAAGLIHGTPDPSDGRKTLLAPTPAGLVWLQEARAARQDWLTRALTTRLTPEEQARLADATALMKRLLDD